jgi:hypothetical protein
VAPLSPPKWTSLKPAAALSTAVFGGFTPAISTYLIHVTGNRAIPGLWLSFAAGSGLVATVLLSSSRLARRTAMRDSTL